MEISSEARNMPKLTEQKILEGQDAVTIRVRLNSTFCINSFLGLSEESSVVKQEWGNLANRCIHSKHVIAQRPVSLVPIAIFPSQGEAK
jgi:hypothetical protein